MRITSLSVVCLCLGAIAGEVKIGAQPASQDIPSLQLNQPITRDLKGGEAHTYRLLLEARMFARVVVEQRGVDVFLRALDGQKKRLAYTDDSFGRVGPQLLEFIAETAGDYFIEVRARKDELGGKYEITYLESQTLTEERRTRFTAARYIVAGNDLRVKATAESRHQAILQYDNALALYRKINDAAGQALSLLNAGRIHDALGDYRKALENYSASLALWRQARDRRGESYTINQIGEMHFHLGNPDLALASYRQALEICREVGDKEGEGLNYTYIGSAYNRKGETARALEYFQKALVLYREVGTKARMGILFGTMGVAYRDLGDLPRAADYQNQALAIWRALEDKHGAALALNNLGIISEQLGETRKALSFHQQALPLCLDLGDQNCEARTYWRLASVYSSLGETQTALDYYAKSAAIYRRDVGRTIAWARMLNSTGALYSSLGEKRRAFEFHNEALALSRKAQSSGDEASTLSHLADLYRDEGNTQKARDLYQQALVISRETKNRLNEATVLNRLGLLAHSGGESHEAIKLFEQALAVNTEVGARYDGALALNNLGMVYDTAGNTKLALNYFNKALAVFREIENKNGEAMMRYRVAVVQRKLGQTEEARRNITAALEIVETIRGKIASTDLRSSYFSTVQEYYDLYIELLMREHQGRPSDHLNFTALQISEQARARGLLDLLHEAKADVRQGVDTNLLAREKELLELINGKAAQQQQAFGDPKKAELAKSLGEEIARLSDEYEALQASIRRSNPRYAGLAQTASLTLPDLQKSLDPQTLLLEYKLGNERSYLWLVSQTGLESFELPPRAQIEGLARQFYESLTERNRSVKGETPARKQSRIQTAAEKLEAVSGQLTQMVLGPVAKSIGDKRLVIVADGALQYVPFAVLVNTVTGPGNGGASMTVNEIISLPSIAVLAQLRRESLRQGSPAKMVAVFADPVFESDDPRLQKGFQKKVELQSNSTITQSLPDFDFGDNGGGLPRLFASREEGKAIMALAPRNTSYAALDFEANRERALSMEVNQYRVLHFATHALLNTARPQLSGIVLSLYDERGRERDGFLRLNQIYNLRLSSELVVLSACSTALGKEVKGEGLVGLTRGFMYAGAPRVIASLWKVDDEATGELMKLFYRNLLQKQMTASRALRTAQVEMQQQARWRSPYYWGAFVLQGEWR